MSFKKHFNQLKNFLSKQKWEDTTALNDIEGIYFHLSRNQYPVDFIKKFIKIITGIDIITFDDLVFKPHRIVPGGVHAFGVINGMKYSVVGGGRGLHGDGTTTFEVYNEDMEEPDGWLNKEEVTLSLIRLAKKSLYE